MSLIRYFALKRLSLYDLEGEPFVLEPGELVPDELIERWGERGVSAESDRGKISPLPAWFVDQLIDQRASVEAPRAKRSRAAA